MKRAVQIVLGLAVSAGALWWTLHGKDLGKIKDAALEADYRYLIPYFGILVAIHFIRTVRWGILLEPVAKIPFAKLNAVSAVGFMALMIVPFRLGEFARPYLVAERPKLRVSAALSSVVVERVADGLFTAILLMVTLLGVPEGTPGLQYLKLGGIIVFGAFAGILAFLILAYKNRGLAVRLTHRMFDPLSPKLAERVSGMMDAFIHGLSLVPSRKKVALFFLLTFVYWAINGYGMGVLARGFGIELSVLATYTLLGSLVCGVMIPAGPGMTGVFTAAIVVALGLYLPPDVVDSHGQAYAYVVWIAQLLQMTVFGVAFMFSRHIRIANIFNAPDEVEEGLEEEEKEYEAKGEGHTQAQSGPIELPKPDPTRDGR
jgi:uncharacterized protein (TIRG00374 family)